MKTKIWMNKRMNKVMVMQRSQVKRRLRAKQLLSLTQVHLCDLKKKQQCQPHPLVVVVALVFGEAGVDEAVVTAGVVVRAVAGEVPVQPHHDHVAVGVATGVQPLQLDNCCRSLVHLVLVFEAVVRSLLVLLHFI